MSHKEKVQKAINLIHKAGIRDEEPCEDTISRQAAIRIAEQGQIQGYEWQFKNLVMLPSVNPQPKTGHWRAVYQGDEIINYRCSECEFGNTFGKRPYRMYYCPNCGAKMIEPQESEVGE